MSQVQEETKPQVLHQHAGQCPHISLPLGSEHTGQEFRKLIINFDLAIELQNPIPPPVITGNTPLTR